MSDTTHPFWNVVGVFDPEGETTDFSYTVGLATRGFPELHLWARPSLGTDPGADWAFSHKDRGVLLNELASSLVKGFIAPRETFVRTYDGGAATVTFTLGDPVPRDELDAYQADPAASVIPVQWTLERVPEGSLTGVADDAVPALQRAWERLTADLPTSGVAALPSEWLPADHLDLAPDQTYGPLTQLVRAQATAVAAADLGLLEDFIHLVMAAEDSIGSRHVISLTLAAARPVGRTAALTQLLEDTALLVDAILGQGPDSPWLSELVDAVGGGDGPQDRERLGHAIRSLLHHAIAALLLTQAVRDVIDDSVRLAGLGPWAWAACADEGVPDEDWLAPRADLEATRALVGGLNLEQLAALVKAHRAAGGDQDGPYDRLTRWLRAGQITSASGISGVAALLADTPAGAILSGLSIGPADVDSLSDVLSILTAARVHGGDIPNADLRILVDTLAPALPGLGQWLDASQVTTENG